MVPTSTRIWLSWSELRGQVQRLLRDVDGLNGEHVIPVRVAHIRTVFSCRAQVDVGDVAIDPVICSCWRVWSMWNPGAAAVRMRTDHVGLRHEACWSCWRLYLLSCSRWRSSPAAPRNALGHTAVVGNRVDTSVPAGVEQVGRRLHVVAAPKPTSRSACTSARASPAEKSKICGLSRSTAISRLLSSARWTASSSVSGTTRSAGCAPVRLRRADGLRRRRGLSWRANQCLAVRSPSPSARRSGDCGASIVSAVHRAKSNPSDDICLFPAWIENSMISGSRLARLRSASLPLSNGVSPPAGRGSAHCRMCRATVVRSLLMREACISRPRQPAAAPARRRLRRPSDPEIALRPVELFFVCLEARHRRLKQIRRFRGTGRSSGSAPAGTAALRPPREDPKDGRSELSCWRMPQPQDQRRGQQASGAQRASCVEPFCIEFASYWTTDAQLRRRYTRCLRGAGLAAQQAPTSRRPRRQDCPGSKLRMSARPDLPSAGSQPVAGPRSFAAGRPVAYCLGRLQAIRVGNVKRRHLLRRRCGPDCTCCCCCSRR